MPTIRLMPLLAVLICFSALPGFAEQTPIPERTLLFLTPSGALQMANVTEAGTRIPRGSFAPGKGVRRFLLTPDGDTALLETADARGICTVWTVDLATAKVNRLGTGLLLPRDKSIPLSPDGRRVVLRRQSRDEAVVLSASTGQVLQTLAVPGMQEAPAWFGNARHVAVPVRLPTGRSMLSIYDAVTGVVRRDALGEATPVRYQFEAAVSGRLVYRETREGVDRWLAVPLDGDYEVVDPPAGPALPPDLPAGAASAATEGPWLAYIFKGKLYLRYAEEGGEPVELADATAFAWKPGPPLPERLLLTQETPAPGGEPTPPAVVPGVLSLRAGSREAVEGRSLDISWQAGAGVAWVRLSAVVERAPVGGGKRGSYTVAIAKVGAAKGGTTWMVPWLDNIHFSLRAEAISAAGKVLGKAGLPLAFRPKELAGETRDGIFVDLSNATRQRLYVQDGGRLTTVYLCSGADTNRALPLNQHPDAGHDHLGTFRVRVKDIDHVSNIDPEWKMPYAMGYLTGHYIHKTARNQYRKLGRPASHGCIRLHGNDAASLFKRTPVGELVVVY